MALRLHRRAHMTDANTHWQRLMHRWFIEYNPLYLVSAALVLVGVNLLSRVAVQKGFLLGQLGVPAIAEAYAWALIASAALLMRIGLRRPAVMLVLLAALYQGDLTLHTETCMYLGWAGSLAAGLWLVSFVAKLFALGWAVQLRLSRSAIVIPSLAALGLVVMPRCLRVLDTQVAAMLVAAWVFLLFASALWTTRSVEGALDGWGETVLRRSLRAIWTMWAMLSILHVLKWCTEYGIPIAVLIPVALLLSTRFVGREVWIWTIVAGTLVVVGLWMPAQLSLFALLSAVVLGLHALRRVRLLAGSMFAAYLSVWTLGWSGGPWPEHVVVLDLALTLAVALVVWGLRVRAPVVVLVALHLHHAVARGIIGAPTTMLEWGALCVSIGFVILIASLAVSFRSVRATRNLRSDAWTRSSTGQPKAARW